MSISNLTQIAKDLDVPGATGMRKQELIFKVLAAQTEKSGLDLLGGRAGDPARRVRLPARARIQLSARPGRHLRQPLADSKVRPADWRHRLGTDSPAERGRALLRAHQGRGHQLRGARRDAREDLLRQPDAALSGRAVTDGDRIREPLGARYGPRHSASARGSAP